MISMIEFPEPHFWAQLVQLEEAQISRHLQGRCVKCFETFASCAVGVVVEGSLQTLQTGEERTHAPVYTDALLVLLLLTLLFPIFIVFSLFLFINFPSPPCSPPIFFLSFLFLTYSKEINTHFDEEMLFSLSFTLTDLNVLDWKLRTFGSGECNYQDWELRSSLCTWHSYLLLGIISQESKAINQ